MSIGDRLREERTRLDRNQDEFAEIGGVQRRAQSNYERGERWPDADYLSRVAEAGVDVLYVVTGRREVSVSVDLEVKRMADAWETLERALIAVNRTLDPSRKRKAAEALYKASKDQVLSDQAQLIGLITELAA
ncbi:helix-turn-helix domain-containing protein [Bordetella avium]|uniref:helix-turn-helix domain-containing protein n=1 Tax=Bordetella avium TaxID=521 RepID=UPI000FD82823|nr:helix-turn-helix transcriptional regulator [Bordetella avium]AZY53276.1 hypothetical protein C0J07_12905 [Bordetella avium]